jgi:L-rhamnose mutarotase
MDRIEPFYGTTNPTHAEFQAMEVKRFGSVVGLDPAKERRYRELHANVWPGVLDQIRRSNIRNFSIYVTELEGRRYLFSHFEYVGDDFEGDMKKMAEDPTTQQWWNETAPCQIRLPNRKPGAQWSEMEMVFLME